jgi:hypothetical protein
MTDAIQTALIAGIAALLGGLVANWNARSLHRMDEAKALRQTYREKLERILGLLGDSTGCIQAASRARTLEELSSVSQFQESRDAYNLSCLYFPELRAPIGEHADSLTRIYQILVRSCDALSSSTSGADASKNPDYKVAIGHAHKLRVNAEKMIADIAKTYNDADTKK